MKMARCVKMPKGGLACVRSNVIIFTMFVMALIVSGHMFAWMFTNTNNVSLKLSNKHTRHTRHLTFGESTNYELDNAMKASTCVFPEVNVYEPSVVEVAGLNQTALHCEGTYLPDLTYIQGTQIIVNTSKVDESQGKDTFQHCKYRHIWRNDSDDNMYIYSDWSEPFTEKIQLPVHSEFLSVQCWNNKSELVSNTYSCLVPRKEEFDDIYSVNLKKRNIESSPKETLNIVMIIMDSLPRNQFIRACNKTYLHLMNTLKSFDLTMHSQLGKNTFPNFLTLFTDHFHQENLKWWNSSLPMDPFDMIWYIFEKAGYRTTYTESSIWGAFNWRNKGFKQPFSRFYPRPFLLAMKGDKSLRKVNRHCAGNQLHLTINLDYIGRLLDTFSDQPVFAVAMMSRETHDDQRNAKLFDEHIFNFYKSMNDKGHLNRTLLVILSDHGTRWGKLRDSVNGYFESRTPFTILTFPEWFLRKYPDVAKNLQTNTKRLTSHFDTHATLLDLLYFKSDTPPPLAPIRHGMSLFNEIPWNRTCKDASIPLEFCLCGYKESLDMDVNSEMSQKIARVLVETINRKTERVCVPYNLTQIMRVIKVIFEGDDAKKEQGNSVYRAKIQTVPGNAIFEAYIYANEESTVLRVGDYIFRLNSYKGQSDCVSYLIHRPMCYCKNLLPHS